MSLPRTLKTRNIKTKQKRQAKYNLSKKRKTKKYKKSRKKPKQTCVFCLENVKRKKHHGYCSQKKHKFHEKCIKPWIDRGETKCPTCRRELNIPYEDNNYWYLYDNLSRATLDEIGDNPNEGTLSEDSIAEITDFLVHITQKYSKLMIEIEKLDRLYLDEDDAYRYRWYTEQSDDIIGVLEGILFTIDQHEDDPDHIGQVAPNWIRDRFLLESNENLYEIPLFIARYQQIVIQYFNIYTNLFEE
jgi:hypothetical protein